MKPRLATRLIAVVMAVASLLLAGCSDNPDSGNTTDNGPLVYGKTWTYSDGLMVTVSKPKKFKPSASTIASVPHMATYLMMTVTVENKSDARYDMNGIAFSAESGVNSAPRLHDPGQGVGSAPSAPLAKGRKVSFKIGFGADDPKDFALTVKPFSGHEPITFRIGDDTTATPTATSTPTK